MRITNYGHAIIISMLGLWIAMMFNGFPFGLLGGMMIGTGLVLARQSGKEE